MGTSSTFPCSLSPLTPPRLLASLLSGLVPEQEDEGQTPETLPAMAAPPHRPAGGAPDEPRLDPLRPAVPLHPAPSPAPPPPPPPLPPGSAVAGLHPASRSLRGAHEDPGRDPPVPLPRQSGRAVTGRSGSVPFHRRCTPPRLVSLSALPALGIRTAAQSQRGTAGTEPTAESQRQNPACGVRTAGGDSVMSEGHYPEPCQAALRKMTRTITTTSKLYQRSGQNAKYDITVSQLGTRQTCKTVKTEADLQ